MPRQLPRVQVLQSPTTKGGFIPSPESPKSDSVGTGSFANSSFANSSFANSQPGVDRERSSLARALARAKQAEELKLQQRKDLRVAAEWNQVFRSAANRRDPEKVALLWGELKSRLNRKFGTINAGLRSVDPTGENAINFLKFLDLLRLVYLPLDQRTSRLLFEKVVGGDHKLQLDELRFVLVEENVKNLRSIMVGHHETQERIQLHLQTFLGRLSQTNVSIWTQAVDRFQRKLTVPLCRELWKNLLQRLSVSDVHDVSVTRSAFEKVVRDVLAHKLLLRTYEVPYMLRLFDRVDTNAGHKQSVGVVKLTSLLSALLLMSPEHDRCLKVSLLFEAFDADEDGCLQYDQLLAMFKCVCAQRPLADEHARGARDIAFQEELAAQEGVRCYERTRWSLRDGKVEGDVVALRELWEALERVPSILDGILPGLVRMRWVMAPSPAEGPVAFDLPKAKPTTAPGGRSAKPRRSVLVPSGNYDKHRPHSMSHSRALAAASSVSWRDERRGFPSAAQLDLESPPGQDPVLKETAAFKESLTEDFKKSLRCFGDLRLTELTEGFNQRTDVDPDSAPDPSRVRTPLAGVSELTRLSRVKSAPAGDSISVNTVSRPPGAPNVESELWGSASSSRFRLFCAVKSSFGRHLMHNSRQPQPDPDAGIGFRCSLCHSIHTFNSPCDPTAMPI